MSDERPKQAGKGDERPKQAGKGDERPKQAGKGGGLQGGANSSAQTMSILRSAAELSGFLVVAVIAPIAGGGEAEEGATSPQKLALQELSRKARLRDTEAGESDI